MSLLETLLLVLLGLLVAVRLLLWYRGGAAAAFSPAQHADALRIGVARTLRGRRARLARPGAKARVPGVAASLVGVRVHVLVEPLGQPLDPPAESALPHGQAPAALGDHRAELTIHVAEAAAVPLLLWSRTPDPRLPEPAADDGAPVRSGDDAFDGWIGARSPDPDRAAAVLADEHVRELCRRLLLVNAPWGARVRADANGLEWTSVATTRTTPEWVARAAQALIRINRA
jgi:hypothetical protein